MSPESVSLLRDLQQTRVAEIDGLDLKTVDIVDNLKTAQAQFPTGKFHLFMETDVGTVNSLPGREVRIMYSSTLQVARLCEMDMMHQITNGIVSLSSRSV